MSIYSSYIFYAYLFSFYQVGLLYFTGKPVTVNVSYSVLSFRDIQEVDMVRKLYMQHHLDNGRYPVYQKICKHYSFLCNLHVYMNVFFLRFQDFRD